MDKKDADRLYVHLSEKEKELKISEGKLPKKNEPYEKLDIFADR